MQQVTYLGPEGTFTHRAALDLAGPGETVVPLAAIRDIVESVETGAAVAGVIAFENSLEGPIPANLDEVLFQTDRCVIAGERIIPVSFDLFRVPGDQTPLIGVVSHPFALAQCSRMIRAEELQTLASSSTAAACRDLAAMNRPGWGAIAPELAGGLYGLEPVRQRLQNDDSAATRFVILRPHCPPASGRDRSAFSFRPAQDEPGSLVRLLQEFSARGVNLTAVKSRPTKGLLGEYVFYVECEGHVEDEPVRDVVLNLLQRTVDLSFHGSFPEDPSREQTERIIPQQAQAGYEELLRWVQKP